MHTKRPLLLAGLVTIALVSMAPAAKAEWGHNGKPVTGAEFLHLRGEVRFTLLSPATSFACEVTATMVMVEGSTGAITDYSPMNNTCEGVGEAQFCGLQEGTSTAPWAVHALTSEGHVNITHMSIANHYKNITGECQLTTTPINFGTVTAEPNNRAAISSLKLSGSALGGALILTGELEVEGLDAGTYEVIP